MPGGYAITDGQVKPATDKTRIDDNLKKIHELDPDIVCLYEVPDIYEAGYISSKLANYPFLIPVCGIKVIGPSSMMYVASKYEIQKDSIEFDAFVKDKEITGRARFSEKGVLSFDLLSKGQKKPVVSIISMHLQHSEIPGKPTKEDQVSRRLQMEKIAKKIHGKIALNLPVIFTGDLNQEEQELDSFIKSNPGLLRRDPAIDGLETWGGDAWCARLQNKPSSKPLFLDYTFIAGQTESIKTTVIDMGYDGKQFLEEASSDHKMLFSKIWLS
jgi:endonuclease/exonuclease/phosphatase family metal-dependent hydrolase